MSGETITEKKKLSVTAFIMWLVSILTCNLFEGVLAAIVSVVVALIQAIPVIGQFAGIILAVPLSILALPITLPCGIIALVIAKKAIANETHPLAKPAKTMGIAGIILGIIDIIIDIGVIILGVVLGIGGFLAPILLALGISSAESFGDAAGTNIADTIFGIL